MFRSMFAAVSGLRNHQTFLDVIGNNIANVNTVGFKAGRILFSDVMSQTTRAASGPQQGQGGINPIQIGLGMQVAGVDTIQTPGYSQATGKITDLAIQGDGYFVYNDGSRDYYSRDGALDLSVDGTIVNQSTGLVLRGWVPGADGLIDTSQPLSAITVPLGETLSGQPSASISIAGNLDASMNGYGQVTQSNATGGKGIVSGFYSGPSTLKYVVKVATVDATTGEVTGIQVSTDNGLTFGATIATSGGTPVDIGNGLSFAIDTNAANAVGNTFSFTATPPTIESSASIYDSLGMKHDVKITFRKTAENTWTWLPSTSEAGVTITPATPSSISFSSTGEYLGQQPAGTIQLALSNGATSPATLALDLSKLTQLAGTGETQAKADGAPAGSLVSFSIDQDGRVKAVYTNGLNKLLGQIALAKFANPSGLLKSGENLLEASANSGDAAIGAPETGSRGSLASGYLEMSNVDLAQQFTNMILASRGFQANSRMITTVEEMLQDLVNMKR
jgi:flagellar hook protein FlgE